MAYRWLESVGNFTLTTTETYTYDTIPIEPAVGVFDIGDVRATTEGDNIFEPSADFRINLRLYNNKTYANPSIYDVPNEQNLTSSTWGGRDITAIYLMIAIDDEAQKADVVYLTNYPAFSHIMPVTKVNLQAEKQLRLYELIQGAIPPLYTWSSVPAISGTNGF